MVPDTPSIQLQGWLAKLEEGDPSARSELINRACSRLQKLIRQMLGDFARVRRFEDTDDVLQNVVVRLMRRLETVRPPTVADFFRLAASEARHELIDLARHYYGPLGAGAREVGAPAQPGDDSTSTPGLAEANSTFDSGRLADWSEFHRQVEALPDAERDVFALLWYNDLTQDEAATVLGVSVPTIKRRWLAARLRLQKWLEGAGEP